MASPPCRTLVAGHDFSPGSRAALRLALAWGSRVESALEVVHALERPAADPHAAPRIARRLREDVDELQRGLAGGTPGTSVASRPVLDVLAGMAAAATDGWIVAGCEGTSGGLESRGGANARALASDRALSAPRLLAPRGFGDSESDLRGGFRRLLVAVPELEDDDGTASTLLDAAADLARRLGARLAAVHSIDCSASEGWPAEARDAEVEAARTRRDAAEDLLGRLFDERVDIDLADRLHVVMQGPVAVDVAGLATSQAADLIVVRAGRTAERLVARTPCPLLVLPAHDEPAWARAANLDDSLPQ